MHIFCQVGFVKPGFNQLKSCIYNQYILLHVYGFYLLFWNVLYYLFCAAHDFMGPKRLIFRFNGTKTLWNVGRPIFPPFSQTHMTFPTKIVGLTAVKAHVHGTWALPLSWYQNCLYFGLMVPKLELAKFVVSKTKLIFFKVTKSRFCPIIFILY